MRPFPFATTISVLIGLGGLGAQQLLTGNEYAWLWPYVMYGGFGLAFVLLIAAALLYFFRKEPGPPVPASGQTASGTGSAAVSGDNSGLMNSPVIIHQAGNVNLGPGSYKAGDGGPGGRGGDLIIKGGDAHAPPPSNLSLSPDLPLAVFVSERDVSDVDGHLEFVGTLFAKLEQKAVLGEVFVWGRKDCPRGQKLVPVTPIPMSYWEAAHVDVVEYLEDTKKGGCTRPTDAGKPYYSDLYLNRTQATAAWPLPVFMAMKDAMAKAYGTLRQTKTKDMLPMAEWSVGDPLSWCAELMSARGLRVYGTHRHSSVRELINRDEIERLHFEKEATELTETFGKAKYLNLQAEVTDFEAHLENLRDEHQ